MKFIHLVGLLVSASLFVVADLTGASNNAPVETSPKLDVEPPKQTFRALSTVQGGDEERFLMRFFEWLMSWFRSGKMAEFEEKLKEVYTLKEAESVVNLMEHAPRPHVLSEIKVDVARRFMESDALVATYKQLGQHHKQKVVGKDFYNFLRGHLGDDVAAIVLEMERQKGNKIGKEMAKVIENAQFDTWTAKLATPQTVVIENFGVPLAKFQGLDPVDWRKQVIRRYGDYQLRDVLGHGT
ncbi:unnamed protein product [Hyaloperonospora brassicae]|uniref:RxLR effector candidate protein n=1 Tax=Hyaloperonospora brassicae TaxID=162125 RepID=A0AAV0UUE2_HYABA|nr:unnamed protein product [Hyaloperonospora brassicae]